MKKFEYRTEPIEAEDIDISKLRIDVAEKELIESALSFCCGDKLKAAERLGLSLRTLKRKIKEYKL